MMDAWEPSQYQKGLIHIGRYPLLIIENKGTLSFARYPLRLCEVPSLQIFPKVRYPLISQKTSVQFEEIAYYIDMQVGQEQFIIHYPNVCNLNCAKNSKKTE